MVELRTQEQQLLSALESLGGKASVEQLIELMRFPRYSGHAHWANSSRKKLITIHAEYQNVIKLTAEGEEYAKNGLPERKLIHAVAALGGAADLKKAAQQAGIESQFVQIALGWAIRKKWALYTSSDNTIRVAEPLLHQAFIEEGCDETLLKYLNDKHQAALEDLSPELKAAAEQLKKRTLLTIEPKTTRTLQITARRQKSSRRSQSSPSRSNPTHTRTYNHRQMAHIKTAKIQYRSASSQNLARQKTPIPAIPRRSPRQTRAVRLSGNDWHSR